MLIHESKSKEMITLSLGFIGSTPTVEIVNLRKGFAYKSFEGFADAKDYFNNNNNMEEDNFKTLDFKPQGLKSRNPNMLSKKSDAEYDTK